MQNSKTPDQVNHPSYYGGDSTYEAVNVIEAWGLGWHCGSAVKYIARAGKKPNNPELQDLKKARWYIDRKIAQLENPKLDIKVDTVEFDKSLEASLEVLDSIAGQMQPQKQLLTWEQADAALKAGKKISHLEWSANSFIQSNNGKIVDNWGWIFKISASEKTSQSFYIINP